VLELGDHSDFSADDNTKGEGDESGSSGDEDPTPNRDMAKGLDKCKADVLNEKPRRHQYASVNLFWWLHISQRRQRPELTS